MSWSVIYFRDSFRRARAGSRACRCRVYMLALSVGRLLDDDWVERWGPCARRLGARRSSRSSGWCRWRWAGSLPLALIGFVLIGFGMSCAFPLSISAAARIGDRPASENVAAFSMIQRTLALGVPAFIGFVAAGWGIAAAFAAMLPLPLASCLRF